MKISRSMQFIFLLVSILLIASLACQISGNPPANQEGGSAPPAEVMPEVTQEPPPQETQPPIEPQPTVPQQPPPETQPPDSGQNTLIVFMQQNAIPILIGLGILLLGIALIVAIVARPRPSTPAPPPSAAPVQQYQPQPQPEQPYIPVPTPQPAEQLSVYTHLQNANPEVVALYQRFADMAEKQGPVSIIPTKTRIDFQVRIIFASVQLYLDSLQINLLLPDKVEHARIQRVDTFGDGKYLHYLVIRSLDDYDVQFATWLQEAYNLGAQG